MSDQNDQHLSDEQSGVLFAFYGALRREAHVLIHQPDLLWQQVHNRLQWEEGPAAALAGEERRVRTRPDHHPWVRTRTPFRESKALQSTLSGRNGGVNELAFSPDGIWIVSASSEKTLTVWDVVSG